MQSGLPLRNVSEQLDGCLGGYLLGLVIHPHRNPLLVAG